MNKKGFTLIEVLTVVLIIGILTAVALPQYEKVIAKARVTEAESMLRTIYDTSERLASEFGYRSYEKLLDAKTAEGYSEGDFSFKRTDMFDADRLPAGCTLSADQTLLNCERFSYKISVAASGTHYVVAKKLGNPFQNTYILLNRQSLSLSCQPDSTDEEGAACDVFGLNINQAGVSF